MFNSFISNYSSRGSFCLTRITALIYFQNERHSSRVTPISPMENKSINPLSVAICQMTSIADKEKNFETCKALISSARAQGAKMVFLPECFDYVGESKKQSVHQAETIDGPLISKYKDIARSHSIWLSLGGFHEKGPNSDKIYNAHVMINDQGEIISVYRKIHLFDVDIPGGIQMKESDYVIPGKRIQSLVESPAGKIGLGICYDMRFPEFSLSMVKAGAEILTFPSAFMPATGKAHWETLLRCRAIETQCYVIAAAQMGKHNSKRSSYGHALVVDPWGSVVASCADDTGIALASIDLSYLKKVRQEMPVWLHRRYDLYDEIAQESENSIPVDSFMFGSIEVFPSQIFCCTKHSVAFVNKKPVLPGHVLISPLRCAERMGNLLPGEISDLFACVQQVQKVIEKEYNASSSTIAIQDGIDAGQSIAHVHVHILPRKPGDFENVNDIYKKLQSHDNSKTHKWRTEEDMAEEAKKLQKYFFA